MLQLDEVSVTAGAIVLLPPVSITVQRGEALMVRGRNGAGKSTLLRVLAGSQLPSSGSVRIGDHEVVERDPRFRRRVAAMIGLPPMASDLTVFDHVLLVATTWMDSAAAALELTGQVLTDLGLGPLEQRFPHELSSGQTQLFGLALVLVRPCEVLILDEPEQRLDPEHIDSVIRTLRNRRDSGVTLVIATHSPRIADGLGDRTITLEAAA
ncbi:ABC transporter ATP-binding protein [Microbacterium sp. H1-D42]|uniref:ABC transporter ATP-binding protein n=1 Tax=Microbacterium sp. H1-D42 TaxID=2925844 RepID=UPI001F53609C|nr:ABC transporter ATP-binding protein [Microbacterium sp. H1-D42]UNK69296.1 ABC transporter ATP-binding protein [Microbacterium sp. H1-D42]